MTDATKDLDIYKIAVRDEGCPHCHAGRTWCVVFPDGIEDGTAWGDEEMAQDIADYMNLAFEAGRTERAKK